MIYLDATGSVLKKERDSPPFYIFKLGLGNPQKNASSLPVATYVTCDHTTPSVACFLEAFQTDVKRHFGQNGSSPIMVVCDVSMVPMQAMSFLFAKKNLTDTIKHDFKISMGKASKKDFDMPILHENCKVNMQK